jgi:hypothetical protein
MHFFMVYCVIKSCTSLFKNISRRVPLAMLETFQCLVFFNRSPSARCARVANLGITDLGISEM